MKYINAITLIVLFLTSCVSNDSIDTLTVNEVGTTYFLEGANCKTPCWVGIVIDQTSFEEAILILSDRYGSEAIETNENMVIDLKPIDLVDEVSRANLFFEDRTVVEILLLLNGKVNFDTNKLIETFGPPVWVQVIRDSNRSCVEFDLLYPNPSIVAGIAFENGEKNINSDDEIFMLRFISPRLIKDYDSGYLVEWSGYKKYCSSSAN